MAAPAAPVPSGEPPFPEKGKNRRICKFYLRDGQCLKDDCNFSHVTEAALLRFCDLAWHNRKAGGAAPAAASTQQEYAALAQALEFDAKEAYAEEHGITAATPTTTASAVSPVAQKEEICGLLRQVHSAGKEAYGRLARDGARFALETKACLDDMQTLIEGQDREIQAVRDSEAVASARLVASEAQRAHLAQELAASERAGLCYVETALRANLETTEARERGACCTARQSSRLEPESGMYLCTQGLVLMERGQRIMITANEGCARTSLECDRDDAAAKMQPVFSKRQQEIKLREAPSKHKYKKKEKVCTKSSRLRKACRRSATAAAEAAAEAARSLPPGLEWAAEAAGGDHLGLAADPSPLETPLGCAAESAAGGQRGGSDTLPPSRGFGVHRARYSALDMDD
eukprot:TRINITY_DN46692_c0_g1_i1.p1 TRINITY_DN46692_c0_g1~~TRINITY_DN46692_c0_g1_i1.p1  ORF type:complete len:403 (+),score=85.79 TRINITY_DN46692_c0_g1_i1:99-1307(+)